MNKDKSQDAGLWLPHNPQAKDRQEIQRKLRPLTRKQKAFVKQLVDNPKASATEAAQRAYAVKARDTARSIAAENLAKPSIQIELAKYSETAENTVVEVMGYSKELGKQGNTAGASYAGQALTAAKDILDRIHGKATQRVEATSQAVTINIDLTGTVDSKS